MIANDFTAAKLLNDVLNFVTYDFIVLHVQVYAAARGTVGAYALHALIRLFTIDFRDCAGRAYDRALAAALALLVEGDRIDIG